MQLIIGSHNSKQSPVAESRSQHSNVQRQISLLMVFDVEKFLDIDANIMRRTKQKVVIVCQTMKDD